LLFIVVVAAAAVVVFFVVGLPCFHLSGFRNSLKRHSFSTNRVRQRNDKGFADNHTISPFQRGCNRDRGGGGDAAVPGGKMNILNEKKKFPALNKDKEKIQ
jgi:hypothetical protein